MGGGEGGGQVSDEIKETGSRKVKMKEREHKEEQIFNPRACETAKTGIRVGLVRVWGWIWSGLVQSSPVQSSPERKEGIDMNWNGWMNG